MQVLLTSVSFHPIRRPGRPSQYRPDGLRSGDGVPPRSLQDGTREGFGHSTSLKVPLARSLQISEELLSRNQLSTAASLGPSGLQNHGQHLILSREASWAKPHYEFNLSRMKFRGNGALNNISDLPFLAENSAFPKMALQAKQDGKKDVSHSSPVDLKIPQVLRLSGSEICLKKCGQHSCCWEKIGRK